MFNITHHQKMQLTMMMGYHLTPIGLAVNKNKKSQVLTTMSREGNLCALLVGIQTGAATMENSMEVSQKIKNRTII